MPADKMKLKFLTWMLLLMAVCICAAAYTNEIEESDNDSMEDIKTYQKYTNAVLDPEDWIYGRKPVDKQRPTISEDTIFLPHEKYCQYFYAFDGTSTYIFKCASRYRFDAEKLQCLKTNSVNCGKRKKKAGSSEEDEIGNEFKCPKWSGLHEHKYYCHLFYDCQDKKPFLKMCPPGMMFDKENKRCNHRQYVDCKKRHDPNGNDDSDNNDPTSDTHEHTMICENSAGVYPHPIFCNKFIRCWYGYGDVYTCPRGTLYDIDLMECRSRSNVKCRGTIDPYTYDDEDEPTLIDHFPDFECPVLQGRFSHFDCDKFYECMYGSSKLYLCPGGTLYDSDKRACREESEVVCNKNIVDEEDEDFVCPAREGIYRDETDCGSYYKCKNSKAEHMQCPKGELFDAEWKSCNDEDDVTCGDRALPGDDSESEYNIVDDNPSYRCPKRHGRFTHEEICNWYYHCKDNMPSVRFCHGSQYYDNIRNICYNNVDCGRRKPKEDDKTITPKIREFVCPSKNGKFTHPKNCGAFYVCKKHKYKLHHCPEGKLFDHKWKSCEPEQEVICGERIHPALHPDEPQDKVVDPNPTFTCIENHGRFEHDDYCDWYYNCHDKKASLRECRRGKYYDKKKRKCIHFRDVSCENRKEPEGRDIVEISSTTEQVVSTAQESVFECPKNEGKFAHERDCSVFYHCKKGKHTIHRCPKNRLFDEERRSCEDEERVLCGHRIHPDMDPDEAQDKIIDPNPSFRCKSSHGRFTHDEHCHWYYHCHDKKASTRQCKKGKYYDTRRKKCYDAKDVSCEGRRKPDDVDVTPEFITTEVSTTETPEFQCPRKEGKFAHERDCGKFYDCKRGEYKIHKCPKNKLFDDERRSCEDDDHVSCGQRIHPDMDPDETQDEIIDPNPNFRCKQNHGTFTHEEYCHWYYHCHDKKASIRQCRKGKYYDTRRKKCYDAKEVSCEGRRKPDDVHMTTEFITTEVPTTETPEFQCPRKEGNFAHERDCGKFYDCKRGEYKIHKCPKNKLFDEKKRHCEDEDNVSCGQRIHPDMDPDEPQDKIVDPTPNFRCKTNHGKFTHEEYCHLYYNCHDKKASVRQCKKGKYYDTRRKKCYDSKDVSCEGRRKPDEVDITTEFITREVSTTEAPKFQCPRKDGKFAHEKDCGKFYDCKRGEYKIHKCPKNKLFDEKERHCEDEDDVSCGERIHPDMDPDEPQDKIVDPNPDFRCKSKHGKYTHEEFCRWYYKCHDKKASIRECRRGKYYDIKKKKCVNSEDVSCGKRKEPEETSTVQPETSTITFPEIEKTSETSIITSSLSTTSEQPATTSTFSETTTTSETSSITRLPSTISEQPATTSTFSERTTTSKTSSITRLPSTISEQPATTSIFPETKTTSETSNITRLPSTISEQPATTSAFPETDITLTNFNTTSSSVTVTEVPTTTTPPRTVTEEPATSPLVSITDELTTKAPVSITGETATSSLVTAAEKPITTSHPITATEASTLRLNMTTTDDSLTTNPQMISTSRRPVPSEHPRTTKGQVTVSAHTTAYEESSTPPPSATVSELQSTTQLPTDDGVNPDKIVDPNPKYDCNGDEGNFPHEKYCHYYFSCKNNKATLRECPEGTYFDMMRGHCEEWYMVSCGDRLTREDVDSTFDDFQSTPFIPERRTISYPDPKTTKEPVSEKPSFECPTEEGFYEHERNCAKYYMCKNKVPEVKTCPEGQLYDTEKRACNEEQETNCGERIHPKDDPDNPDKIPDKVIDPNPDFNCTHRHGCFTHDVFCKWYYYCHDNRPEVRECAGDEYFDSVRNKCLDWWMVICDKRIVPEETTLFPITDATKDQGTTSHESKQTGSTAKNNIGTDFTHNWSRKFSTTDSDEKTGITSIDSKWTGNDKWTTRNWGKTTRPTDRSAGTDSGRWSTRDWSKGPRSTYPNEDTDSGRWTTRDWSKRPWFTARSGGTDSGRWTTSYWTKGPGFTDGTGGTDSGRWTTRDWSKRPWFTARSGGTDSGRWTTSDWTRGPGFTDGTRGTDSSRWTTRDRSEAPWFTGKTGGTDNGRWTTRDWSKGPWPTDGSGGTDNGRWTTKVWSKEPLSTIRNGGTGSDKWPTSDWSKETWPTEKSRGTDSDKWTRASSKETVSTDITNFIITSTSVSITCEDDHKNQPHETDCSLYFQCKNGIASIEKCPAGMLFNRIMKQCYREDWVDCDHRKRPEIGVTDDPTATERPIEDLCKEEDGDFHHPKDCRLYYTCRDGESELNECPVGMLFDNAMRACFDENRVNCGKRYRPQTTTQTPDDCDEWLRTLNTTVGTVATSPGSGIVSPIDKETGGTDSTDSRSSSSIDIDKNRSTQTENHGKDSSSTESVQSTTDEPRDNKSSNTPTDLEWFSTETSKFITESSKRTSTEAENSRQTHEKTVSSAATLSTIQEDFKTQTVTDEAGYSTLGLKSTTMTKGEGTSNKNIFTSPADKTENNRITGDDLSTISPLNTQDGKTGTNTASTKPSDNPGNTKPSTEDDASNKDTTNNRRMTSGEPEIGSTSYKNTGKTKIVIIPTTETGSVVTEQTQSSGIPKTGSPVTNTNTDSEFKTSEVPQNTGTTSTAEGRTDISLETRTDTGASTAVSTDSGKGKEIIPTREGTRPSDVTDDKIGTDSASTITMDYNTGESTPYGVSTTHHTTQHPCLTHTHSTQKPTVPPKTKCGKDDIDCITKETGDVEKWYKCPKRQGNFPHPSTDRLFIYCRNWKPRVKRCAKDLVFSPAYMRCIRP